MIDFNDLKRLDISALRIVVTGANSGIGYESALYFASKGARVFLCARRDDKGLAAKASIQALYPQAKLEVISLDLADSRSIRSAVETLLALSPEIDVVLNNAGIMAVPYQRTQDGFEAQMGVNHLGHVVFTQLLLQSLKNHVRIVNVSSMAYQQGRLDFSNMMFEKGGYQSFVSYARSKLANLLFTQALNTLDVSTSAQLTALSAHPGVAKTRLFDKDKQASLVASVFRIFDFMLPSAQAGAKAIIAACIDPQAEAGHFYGPYKSKQNNGDLIQLQAVHPRVLDKTTVEAFWSWSQAQVASILTSLSVVNKD
jgi:NAD(P)-dependent dehydrogenase (short-subunit alcohol dehydrogenase family)